MAEIINVKENVFRTGNSGSCEGSVVDEVLCLNDTRTEMSISMIEDGHDFIENIVMRAADDMKNAGIVEKVEFAEQGKDCLGMPFNAIVGVALMNKGILFFEGKDDDYEYLVQMVIDVEKVNFSNDAVSDVQYWTLVFRVNRKADTYEVFAQNEWKPCDREVVFPDEK